MKRISTSIVLSLILFSIASLVSSFASAAEESVAMKWNRVMLNGIRKDAARPTVQARNLYHASVIMYDAWAVYDDDAATVFLGKTLGNYTCPFNGIMLPENRLEAQEKAISYAMYRFMAHRYGNAPLNNWNNFILGYCNELMDELGYPTNITSTDYSDGDPAKLGNYIAARMQEYAFQDGSNQQFNYANLYYQTVNGNLFPELPGNAEQYDGNRWQPLSLTVALDQNGFPISNGAPALSVEWGNVVPFALTDADKVTYQRDGHNWNVYHDQGHPPYLDTISEVERQWDEDFFRWGFATVAIWHSFHDTADGVMMDISPNNIGNINTDDLPTTFEEYKAFYDVFNGGTIDAGYDINPVTGLPYEENIVPRADYTRVLSEYWADGPQSETPPGHWFVNINNINTHPLLEKRWRGEGPVLDDLEWDVRSYLALGGGIHDAAVACWSTKGYYDFTRPIMAIRYMIDHGQCSDMSLPNYDPAGIPLIPGFIEVVEEGDELAGENNEHVGKIKLYTFRGPVEATGQDGVGWILGENWWTFQVRTFVTPPFPGFYSGHSTYSRAAAEILTQITGSDYYPGGMGEFVATQNEYLRASPGPSVTTRLQWARYADAADQCSLSRIYGGLHPPCDDIPGRKVGMLVGPAAVTKAEEFILAGIPHVASITADKALITDADAGTTVNVTIEFTEDMDTSFEPVISYPTQDPSASLELIGGNWIDARNYVITYTIVDANQALAQVVLRVNDAKDPENNSVVPALQNLFTIDTFNPSILAFNASDALVNDEVALDGIFTLEVNFNEIMNQTVEPTITWENETLNTALVFNSALSFWSAADTYTAFFDVVDTNIEENAVANITGAVDSNGNEMNVFADATAMVDTKNPFASLVFPTVAVNISNVGNNFAVRAVFDEEMSSAVAPTIALSGTDASPVLTGLVSEGWFDANTYEWVYATAQVEGVYNVNVTIAGGEDLAGNDHAEEVYESALLIDFDAPAITSATALTQTITDANAMPQVISVAVSFDENMDTNATPVFEFSPESANSFVLNTDESMWMSSNEYLAVFDALDLGVEGIVTLTLVTALDAAHNSIEASQIEGSITLDTHNPTVDMLTPSAPIITNATADFTLSIVFDEAMNASVSPTVSFTNTAIQNMLVPISSLWINATTYEVVYSLDQSETILDGFVEVSITNAQDALGNPMEEFTMTDVFNVDVVVGIDENGAAAIQVYPNPVRSGNDLVIELPQLNDGVLVELFDASGKRVAQEVRSGAVSGRMTINTAQLAVGTYVLRIEGSGVVSNQQIIVTK